jgi:acyl-CoA synthetase (NDP forming)
MLGMSDLDLHEVGAQLVGHLDGLPDDDEATPTHARRVPTFSTPEEAVRALATVVQYGQWRRRDPGTRLEPEGRDRAAAELYVAEQLAANPDGVELDPRRTAELLALYGVEVWPSLAVSQPKDAEEAADRLGWPVALKTTAPHLRHRVDLGGVRLDIADADELADDLVEMRERLTPLGGGDLVVQRMAPAGVACVVRTVEDPLFGPVVSFGLGGDASELLGDVAHRIAPLTDVDVADLIRSVRAAPKLFGHRGAQPVDTDALEDVVARISCMADELPEIASLELNPVVVSERGASVLGAIVTLAPVPNRVDAVRRELTDAD